MTTTTIIRTITVILSLLLLLKTLKTFKRLQRQPRSHGQQFSLVYCRYTIFSTIQPH